MNQNNESSKNLINNSKLNIDYIKYGQDNRIEKLIFHNFCRHSYHLRNQSAGYHAQILSVNLSVRLSRLFGM